MIRPVDADELTDELTRLSIPAWCAENGVTEAAVIRVVERLADNEAEGAVAISAFRLGHEARKRSERGLDSPDKTTQKRYVVQSVVVDTETGALASDPFPQRDLADDVAGGLNDR